jgi:polyisoprenoid-binding protein YceI
VKIHPSVNFKYKIPKFSTFLAAVVLGLAALFPAGAQTRYNAQPHGTSVKIDGTSTAHDWEMEGTLIGGFIEFEPGVTLDAAQTTIPGLKDGKVPVKVRALIPVTSVHSNAEHAPDIMDHLMQKALKADDFGKIEYTLTDMTFKGPHVAGQPFNFDTTGNLSIAGVTNKVSFPITLELSETNQIKINATMPLKMTSFGVDPPAPNIAAGLFRCGDDIKIIIDWTLKERNRAH